MEVPLTATVYASDNVGRCPVDTMEVVRLGSGHFVDIWSACCANMGGETKEVETFQDKRCKVKQNKGSQDKVGKEIKVGS